jgi:hypothetical protein
MKIAITKDYFSISSGIRLEFEKKVTLGSFVNVNLNPIGDKKLRFSI